MEGQKHTAQPCYLAVNDQQSGETHSLAVVYGVPPQPTEDGKGQAWLHIGVRKPCFEVGNEEQEANARRLVACWNACLGITTEQLEAGAVTVSEAETRPNTAAIAAPDYKELAYDMADAMGKMLTRLKATSDWMGTLRSHETGESYTWEEMFARLIERLPGLEVDRRYIEAKGLPAKQRRARYWELDQEMAERRRAAAEAKP